MLGLKSYSNPIRSPKQRIAAVLSEVDKTNPGEMMARGPVRMATHSGLMSNGSPSSMQFGGKK